MPLVSEMMALCVPEALRPEATAVLAILQAEDVRLVSAPPFDHGLLYDVALFTNRPLIEQLRSEGAFVFTSGWLCAALKGPLPPEIQGDDVCTTVLLDTGVISNTKEQIKALGLRLDHPTHVVPVGLDMFTLALDGIILNWRHRRALSSARRLTAKAEQDTADYAIVVDFLSGLSDFDDEGRVQARLEELFFILFAPTRQTYLSYSDADGAGVARRHTGQPLDPSIVERLRKMDTTLVPLEGGFCFTLQHDRQILAAIAVEDVAFPEHLKRYEGLARVMSVAGGIALANARIHVRLHRAETHLRETNQGLEDRIEARTEALREALADAQSADHAKTSLLAHMSHELRTPLNAIQGFSQHLLTSTELDAEAHGYVRHIIRAGTRLLGMVNNALALAKVRTEISETQAAPLDLHLSLRDTLDLLSSRPQSAHLHLHLELHPNLPRHILIDGEKVQRVIVHLLDNATAFTERGHVTLRASAAPHHDTGYVQICVEVEDTGAGISTDALTRIFEPFSQEDAGQRIGGGGLGLAVCERISAMLDGHLKVQSTLGEGSTFSFSFPVRVLRDAPISADIPAHISVAPKAPSPPPSTPLPAAILARLRQAVIEADLETVESLAAGLLSAHPDFSADLSALSEAFDYDGLSALLNIDD